MKKLLSVILAAGLTAGLLTGCSGGNTAQSSGTGASAAADAGNSGDAASTEKKEGAKTAVAADAYEIMCAYENNPGEPVDLACQFWKEKLEELSGGTMTMTLYPSSQMGNKNQIIDMALAGDPIITIGNDSFYADMGVNDFNVTFAPFLIHGWEDFDTLHDSEWYQDKVNQLEGLGLHLVSNNWRYGIRHLLSKKPVQSMADIKGMKVRTPNSTAEVDAFVAMGANPTPMALSDVYTALQQGTIDAVENPLDVLYNNAFHEVVTNLTLTGHVYINASWLFSEDLFNQMTPEQQGWFLESGEAAADHFNELVDQAAADALEQMKAKGVTVYEINPDDFAQATDNFAQLDDFKKTWSADNYETVKKILGR